MVATVETVGFDFRIVIFPKEYEKYESKIEEDMIVVVDGRIKFDRESGEVSIFPSAGFGKKRMESEGAVKCFSITVFREMALTRSHYTSSKDEKKTEVSEAPFLPQNQGANYIIDVPSFWIKEDLLDLRDYLSKAEDRKSVV